MNSLCISRLAVLRHVIRCATVITTHTRNATENSLFKKPGTNSRTVDLPSNVIILGVDSESTTKICSSPTGPIPVPDELEVIRKANKCHRQPVRARVDAFEVDFTPTSAVELHPEVFCSNPRIDFLYLCMEWQSKYREVDYSWKPTRGEMGRGRKRPWPRSGIGRSRHTSKVAPQWKGGGVAHGPRGPKSLFQKINPQVRLKALTSALSIKFFQQDLCVVNSLHTSSPEPDQLKEILINKGIGSSALLVYCEADDVEENSNISTAVEDLAEVNLMPLVGLNVWSLLHHDKLVLTVKSLNELETKVLWNMNRYDWIGKPHNFYRDLPFSTRRPPFAKIENTD